MTGGSAFATFLLLAAAVPIVLFVIVRLGVRLAPIPCHAVIAFERKHRVAYNLFWAAGCVAVGTWSLLNRVEIPVLGWADVGLSLLMFVIAADHLLTVVRARRDGRGAPGLL